MEQVILTVRLGTGMQSIDVEASPDIEVMRLAEQVALAKGWVSEVDPRYPGNLEVYGCGRRIHSGETLRQVGIVDGAVLTVRVRGATARGPLLHSSKTGISYWIKEPEAIIGRFAPGVLAADNLGRLLDMSREPQGTTVSRLHARIVLADGKWHLIPEKTTNPTLVNGKLAKPGIPYTLENGDYVQLGAVSLQFLTQR